MASSVPQTPDGRTPEARVLIVMTGGTICMKRSEEGYVPARDFLDRCMGPRPEFNDGTELDPVSVNIDDGMLHYHKPPVHRSDKCPKHPVITRNANLL